MRKNSEFVILSVVGFVSAILALGIAPITCLVGCGGVPDLPPCGPGTYEFQGVCNNDKDDDCDGLVDEGCLGAPCYNDSECSNNYCSTPAITTDGKPGGVCAIPCETDADCPTGALCFNTWSNGYTGELRFSCLPAK